MLGDRILCLENALRQASPETDKVARNEEAARLPEADVPSDDVQPSISTEQVVDISSDTAEIGAEPTPTDSATPASDDFGLKEQRSPKKIEAMKITVISVRKNLSGRYVFDTADSQTWIQTDQRTVRLENTPFTAEIRPASMGSFYLKPDAGSVSIRVRREK